MTDEPDPRIVPDDEVVPCPEGVDPIEHADTERIKQARFLISKVPDLAIVQCLYLIRLGAEVPLEIAKIFMVRIRQQMIANDIQAAGEGLAYLKRQITQVAMAAQWVIAECEACDDEIVKESKIINAAIRVEKAKAKKKQRGR